MRDISLKALLEAGCHFGHRVERWHPKAESYIYQAREGIHIIDLVKTRDGLKSAAEYIKELALLGQTIIFVATKRQAKGLVKEAAIKAGIPYMTNRWIGGFLTNWDEVKKNIDKLNKYEAESKDGSWSKFPKHEVVKLQKMMRRLESIYGGVKQVNSLPQALFIVDIKKEESALREAVIKNVKTVAIVDTNVNPINVDFPIPANDDAIGSVQFITDYLAEAYLEGKQLREKQAGKQTAKTKQEKKPEVKPQKSEIEEAKQKVNKAKKELKKKEKVKQSRQEAKKIAEKKRGRPKKAKK